MSFPSTNKIHNDQRIGSTTLGNAKILEEMAGKINKVNWKVFIKAWAIILAVILVSLFLLIVTIKLALSI